MAKANDYREYAKKCFVWAQQADGEELRRSIIGNGELLDGGRHAYGVFRR